MGTLLTGGASYSATGDRATLRGIAAAPRREAALGHSSGVPGCRMVPPARCLEMFVRRLRAGARSRLRFEGSVSRLQLGSGYAGRRAARVVPRHECRRSDCIPGGGEALIAPSKSSFDRQRPKLLMQVSLLPPVCLGLEPTHWVLDMCATACQPIRFSFVWRPTDLFRRCAAPGSKTMQCLDLMQAHAVSRALGCLVRPLPNGPVQLVGGATRRPRLDLLVRCDEYCAGTKVANDIDTRFLLSCRTRKTPTTSLMVTVGNAARFPVAFHARAAHGQILFDRIVCDVPCSGASRASAAASVRMPTPLESERPCAGDGTLRKNPQIWRGWSVAYELSLVARPAWGTRLSLRASRLQIRDLVAHKAAQDSAPSFAPA
jgi:hypothetical protein